MLVGHTMAEAASECLRDIVGNDKISGRLVFGVASLPLGTPLSWKRWRNTKGVTMAATTKHGIEVIQDPSLNKPTAFSESEKQAWA